MNFNDTTVVCEAVSSILLFSLLFTFFVSGYSSSSKPRREDMDVGSKFLLRDKRTRRERERKRERERENERERERESIDSNRKKPLQIYPEIDGGALNSLFHKLHHL